MDIGGVLSRAWQIIWRHKVLWIFGIFAGCGSAGSGSGSSSFSTRGDFPQDFNLRPGFIQWEGITDWQIALIVGAAFLIFLVLVILVIFLGTIGRIGLIRGTQQVEGGAESLALGELFSGSLPYFLRVFGLNLLVGLVLFLGFGVLITFVVLGGIVTLGIGLICLLPLLCVAVPVTWVISILVKQASIAIVIEDLGVIDGLKRGWEVVKTNIGLIIVMGLILFVGVGTLGSFIIGLPVAFIVAPFVIDILVGSGEVISSGFWVSALCFVGYLPVLIVLNGILQGYIESAWTLTYMRLTAVDDLSEPALDEPKE